ncbi:MAG: hypothetical protein ACTHOH_02865 [Lysobacteraceae bacterium]
MAMGADALGVVYFCAIKFGGYTAMAAVLRRRYPGPTAAPWAVGLVRTLIGLAVGIGVMLAAAHLHVIPASAAFYLLLLPVRLAEWLLLLRLFYERPEWRWKRALGWASIGYVWSCLLDLPALAAVFLLPGGVWIC